MALLQTRRLSSRELLQACLERIAERDGDLHAWVRVYEEDAHGQAAVADRRRSAASVRTNGPPHPLCGIPVGIKDAIAIGGKPLTAGSRALHDNVPAADAGAVRRLRDVGMVLLGHTRTQEFAYGRAPQTVTNAWDHRRSPGGSSNGSAVAVASRTVPVALGTDTGGSIRRPASACGISAMVGTYGAVGNTGVVSTQLTLTQIGPLTSTVADAGLVLSVLSGANPYDPSTPDAGPSGGLSSLVPTPGRTPLAGRRIGVLTDFDDDVAAPIGALFTTFTGALSRLGARLVDVSSPLPYPAELDPDPELVAFHRDLFARREELYGPHMRELVRDALRRAPSVTALDHLEAQRTRSAYSLAWSATFRSLDLDAVVAPSQSAETPLRLHGPDDRDDVVRFGAWRLRRMWNLAGFPMVGLPMGLTATHHVPVGAQLVGAPWSEAALGQLAVDVQQHTSHHQLRPPGRG